MILSVLFSIIVAVCLVSTIIFYAFMRTRGKLKSSSMTSINEKQQIKYSLRPSIDIITKKLNQEFSLRTSLSSNKSNRSSSTINEYEENELDYKTKRKSIESISAIITPFRSASMVTNLFQPRRPRGSHWRQGSIVDPNQMALIPFSLPINNNNNNKDNNTHHNNDSNKYRRRSVAVCNHLMERRENAMAIKDLKLSSLLSFSVTYLKKSQIKVQFHSLHSLPSNIFLEQLIIQVKLIPDGKEKSIRIKKSIRNETTFDNESDEFFVLFSNISYEKFQEQSLSMTINGKDQTKKTIHIGYIGKINFDQINKFQNECRVDFLHAIEKIKPSSIELFVLLEKNGDQHIHIDVQRIKGLKINQKQLDATCYLQIILLDRHRPLTIQKTKYYRLKSSNLVINEEYDFNILTYNNNNLDRLMIMFNLYSNSTNANEYKCIAHMKLGTPLLCSGSGTVHWQQFIARESFSMWHTLNKE